MPAGGFEVFDLGCDVRPERFVEAARQHGADVVAMSALLTTTMPAMGDVIRALRSAGLDEVRTIVGGAQVDARFAESVGADAYGSDPAAAVRLARLWARESVHT